MEFTYSKWQYWVCRKWQTSVKNKYELIGFATTVASFGKDGGNCYPLNFTLENLGNVSRSTVKRLRTQCLELGLFTEVGKTYKGVRILEISIPADDVEPVMPMECFSHGGSGCECDVCTEYRIRFFAYARKERRTVEAKTEESEPVYADTPPW